MQHANEVDFSFIFGYVIVFVLGPSDIYQGIRSGHVDNTRVGATTVIDFDPSDYFGQHSSNDDDSDDFFTNNEGSSSGAFSRLPVTVQDGIQYAYSSVRIRDQVSFFILPKSGRSCRKTPQ